jgi:hypothetical protein
MPSSQPEYVDLMESDVEAEDDDVAIADSAAAKPRGDRPPARAAATAAKTMAQTMAGLKGAQPARARVRA